jgi:hypothetical protein
MAELYNTQTRQPEGLPDDQISQAVLAGTHSYAADDKVNVVDPHGKVGSVDASQLQSALSQGFKVEGKFNQSVREYQEDNKGLKGDVKVALGKFADEATMGIAGLIYEKKGDPLEVAKWEALKKDHEVAKALGSAGGFGASLFVGGPLFKGAGIAGEAAARGVAEKLAAVGIEQGSKSMAKDILARMAEKGVQLGTEGAITMAPQAITEAALGDPEQAGESLLIGAGVGASLGLAGGFLGGALKKLNQEAMSKLEKGAKSAGVIAEDAAEKTHFTPDEVANMNLTEATGALGASDTTQNNIFYALKKRKANADDIISAHEKIGAPVLEGSVSASPFVQDMHSSVINSPTAIGVGQRQKLDQAVDSVRGALQKSFGEASELSAAEVGDKVKNSLVEKVTALKEANSALYQELGETAKVIPIREDGIKQISKDILDIPKVKQGLVDGRATTSGSTLAKGITDRLGNAKTLEDLDIQIQMIREELGMASTKGEQRIAGVIRDKLDNFYDNILDEQFSKRDRSDLLQLRQKAKSGFAEIMQKLSPLAEAAGKKNIDSPGAFIDFLHSLPPEKLAEKLFSKNNSEMLGFFQKSFPEEFKEIVQYQRGKILNSSMFDDKIVPHKVFSQVKKLSPEVQSLLMEGENKGLFDAAKTVYESLPKNINPSGTSKGEAFKNLFSMGGLGANATDSAKLSFIKGSANVDGLLMAEQAMKKMAQKLDEIPESIKSLGRTAHKNLRPDTIGAISRMFEDEPGRHEGFKRISEKLGDHMGNPGGMAKAVGDLAGGIEAKGAPQIAMQFNQKMTQALQYLHVNLPKPLSPPNPFNPTPFKPSDQQLAQFERKLGVVQDPFSVISDLKKGTLTQDQMDALKAVYPKVYDQIRTRIMQTVMDDPKAVSYSARVKLSMLMQTPLDPSLNPQAIAGYQAAFHQAEADAPQGKMNLNIANLAMTDRQKSNI